MHSEHFSEKELRCKCCGENETKPELLELAEAIRAFIGEPMIVHCAYRCPKHNAEVGGENGSKHIVGQAMDFSVKGMSPKAIYDLIRKNAEIFDHLGGIGLYDWGIHVDTYKAPDGHLRLWDYRKSK